MKTFIVFCLSLCLVEGSKGMPCFMLCFYASILILHGCNAV